LLGRWYGYGGKFRYIVVDRNKKNERTIVEVPQQEYGGMYLCEMSSDGLYGVCILSSSGVNVDAYENAITKGTNPYRDWDAIGIIVLP
jgi:hypothetical protein